MSRFLAGLVLIVGLVFIVKAFVDHVRETTPPPTQYIMHAESRITPDGKGIAVTNLDPFPWPQAEFTINGKFRLQIQDSFPAKGTRTLTLSEFKDSSGAIFPGAQAFSGFDIETATMAWDRKR